MMYLSSDILVCLFGFYTGRLGLVTTPGDLCLKRQRLPVMDRQAHCDRLKLEDIYYLNSGEQLGREKNDICLALLTCLCLLAIKVKI